MNDDKIKIINHKIKKALATLDDSFFLIDNKKFNAAVNRIYYSVFYILSALALKYDYETSKHSQLLGWFNKNFIANKSIDIQFGKTAMKLFDLRTKADYDDFIIFKNEQVQKMYEEAKIFIEKIIKFINEK